MRTFTIYGIFRLAQGAAESYARMRAESMPPRGINSAWRSTDAQRRLFLARYVPSRNRFTDRGPFRDVRFYEGQWYKRMRGYPVSVPGTSKHNQGVALDTSSGRRVHKWLLANGESHGWHRPLPTSDPVHFEYRLRHDRARARKGRPGWHVVNVRVLRGRAGPSLSARILTRKRRKEAVKIEKWVKGDGLTWGVTAEGIYFAKQYLTKRV